MIQRKSSIWKGRIRELTMKKKERDMEFVHNIKG
jgi:hypothetical protein